MFWIIGFGRRKVQKNEGLVKRKTVVFQACFPLSQKSLFANFAISKRIIRIRISNLILNRKPDFYNFVSLINI
jgi:hypothetical protein